MNLSRKSVISSAISDGVLNKRTHRICKILNDIDDRISIAPATGFIEFLKGMEMTNGEYRRTGIVKDSRSIFLYNEGLLNPNSTLFLARKEQDILGTISVIGRHENHIPCARLFREELDALRLEQRKVVELGTLSVKHQSESENLVFMLYLKIMIYTIFVEKVDDIFIQVKANVASFYVRNFLFKKVGKSKLHPDYSNLEASLLRVDVKSIREKIYVQKCYGSMGWLRILNELGLLKQYRVIAHQCRQCSRFTPDKHDAEVYQYLCNL